MEKNNIFLTLLVLLLIYGCATSHPKYAEGEPTENFGYPSHKKVEKSFYLLGDGGYSQPGGTSEGLLAFKTFLDSVKQIGNYTIFLGDNIYPDGMVAEGHPRRESAEYRLDSQIDVMEDYDGNVIFIPGNHDWYNEGIAGLKREEDYLQEKLERDDIYYPEAGCALKSIEITENIQLIILDSQWYLTNWDNHPTVNDDCEIKTREAMFLEIDSELKKNQNKTVVFALHHPLYTNGVHGGQYNFDQHVYPSQKKIPLPLLGSLVMLVRTTGGISIQDTQNERYKSLVRRLETISKSWGNVIFVSGHEHSIQYIEKDHIKQIVSGSGSKANYAGLSNTGLFAYSDQGFAALDIFEDGSSWVSFYGSVDNKPKLMYQKEVFPKPEPVNTDTIPESFPQLMTASIYEPEETEKGAVYESVWGDRYRNLYSTNITVPVVELDTLFGGLEVIRAGGGHQTRSLRLKDSLGRDYNMRALEKSAVQFLQTVAYQDTPIQSDLENTVAEEIIRDFYTSSHPYGFMAIPRLSEAVNLFHTNPKLYYVPKQEALGAYNTEYGDELYMIVERPEENWMDYESFGKPNHDIESTAGVFERLRRDEKYILDESLYIRARIFDMLVGDWDRHQDQWRWSEFENEEGIHIFKPIPRDRDQVFSNYDGAFMSTLRGLTGIANQFSQYEADLKDVKWFNQAAVGLDRGLIQNEGREEWLEQAEYIQTHITDEVIEEAFAALPPETRGEATERIKAALKGRRDNLIDITKRYYEYLAKTAIVTGTDKDDYIEVERLPGGETRISVHRIKDGEKADVVNNRVYDPEYTKEIWLYGLDDEDIFEVYGDSEKEIKLLVIGGQDHDIFRIDNGNNIKVFDYESMPNTIERNNGAEINFTDDYEVNVFDKDKKVFTSNVIVPAFGYNPDDGVRIGIKDVYTVNGFRRNPFTTQHRFMGGYYFATQGFDITYEGEFASVWKNFNLAIGAKFTSPNYTQNFFGFGNETANPEDELTKDYNRIKLSSLGAEIGFVRKSPFGSFFKYMLNFEGIKVESTDDRFLAEEFTLDPENFERKYFAGAEGIYRYESYDYVLNPTNGMKFELVVGGKLNTGDTERFYGYINPYWGFYNAVTRNRKLVLHTRAQAEINLGNDFEFYQAATLGGENGLRGYRTERFTGKKSFAVGTDLRYSFDQFHTDFLPFQIGVFAGYDIGRVWVEDGRSKVWHDDYGGGFWVNSAEAINGTFSLFQGEDGLRFSFGFGFSF